MALIAMKCPGCGADIEMDDSREFRFCTYCGTKVMQDKLVVEHKGNVKIDNSEFVQKYLQNRGKKSTAKKDLKRPQRNTVIIKWVRRYVGLVLLLKI